MLLGRFVNNFVAVSHFVCPRLYEAPIFPAKALDFRAPREWAFHARRSGAPEGPEIAVFSYSPPEHPYGHLDTLQLHFCY